MNRPNIAAYSLIAATLAASCCVPALGKTTITFAGNYYSVPLQNAWFKKVTDDFNQQSTTIHVKLVQGVGADKLAAMSAAGTVPDAVQFDRYLVAYWARAGLFAPLDKWLPRSVDIERDFIPGAVQEASWKGEVYALPMTSDIRGLFWNKRLLQEAGLNDEKGPTTWEELNLFSKKLTITDGAGKIKQSGLIPWDGNWYSYGWVWAFGGDYYDLAKNKPTLDAPKVVDYLHWIGDVAKTMYTPSQVATIKAFESEGQAMQVSYYGAVMPWSRTNKKLSTWIAGGECPHPAGGKNGTWAGGMCWAIPAGAKRKAAAGEFLAYLASTPVATSFYELTKEWPPSYKGLEAVQKQMDPLEAVFMKQLPVANHRRPFTDVLGGLLSTAESQVANAKKSPEAAAAEAQQNALRLHPSLWQEKVAYRVK